jgi:general secretion pathway protein K
MIHSLKDQHGMALVVTLLAVVLITALVVEFSYGVYTGTSNLYNWRDSQRLSLMARSGVHVSARFLSERFNPETYSYPGSFEFPAENPFDDFKGVLLIRIEDENAKFNVNAIVHPDGKTKNEAAYNALRRLLKILGLDERIADRLVDWIDLDSVPELTDSEREAKNLPLHSVDELLLIPGLTKNDYTTLLPYVTVYGARDNLSININGAEKPVLRCLSDKITDELAQRVIDFRKNNPFQETSDLSKVAGFERDTGIPPGVVVAVKGENFSIKSAADSGGVKRIIETVLNAKNGKIAYWKEY